jgi:carbon-monoxide dehydrogenase large subunit
MVRIGRSGRVLVATGAMPMGQGTKTMLAQICAAELGLEAGDIEVVAGDTAAIPMGLGGFASRQTVTAGSSVHLAAGEVRAKVLKMAAHLLEAAEEDLELAGGDVRVKGASELSVSLRDVAEAASGVPGYALPPGVEPGLEASANFMPTGLAYSNSVHAVEVEVDVETGAVTIRRYLVVSDCGRRVNPMMVDGQVRGGAVHGIGNGLYEWMGFDQDGQPITTNFADYLLPSATEVPAIELVYNETPSPMNPLGVKGVGESGTVPAAAAIASAIEDALRPYGVRIDEVPVMPGRIVELIAAAGGA